MKYLVTVARLGGIVVEAETMDDAIAGANMATLDDIEWDDDWGATGAVDVAEEWGES